VSGRRWCHYVTKVFKKNDACKAKIAASEDFALAETFFALAESCPALQICPFTHFQPQFTHFQPKANNTPATPVIDEERPAPRNAKQALALCNTAGEVTTADLILHPW
jgi:hypothetical protein